ncbi:MAG: DUF3883 domain-containing protein [Rhodobacter sp.]|nr:DUF3883 domain-containing protein [Rhodobacter sp.]
MSRKPWTDHENDLIVADYFAMLEKEVAGRDCNKTEHRRALMPLLQNRSKSAIEFKHRNISAALRDLGEDRIRGYRPARNYQEALIDSVARWLDGHPEWIAGHPARRPPSRPPVPSELPVGVSPVLSNRPPPVNLERMIRTAAKFDVAGRDERNRVLGEAGERRALEHERAALTRVGRSDLARMVRWVSREDGDGAGYDISSFDAEGRSRLIEVKTTNGWERTPFFISLNEIAMSRERPSEWRLFRLWNFSREAKAFEIRPPLEAHVSLTCTAFRADFTEAREPHADGRV